MISLRFILPLSFVGMALSSCGYAIEKSHQGFTLLTPGAENAHCFVYIDKVKYQMYPPQTINIMKSENDMEVVCKAPGNRDASLTVPAEITPRAVWGGPGMAWDYASKSLHHYPSVVALDFSQEETRPFGLPKHNSADIQRPEDHLLEEISASNPRLNADRNRPKTEILRIRGGDTESNPLDQTSDFANEGAVEPDKGDLMSVIERLQAETSDSDSVEGSSESSDDPVQIYPGE